MCKGVNYSHLHHTWRTTVATMKAFPLSRKNRNKAIVWREKKTMVQGNWPVGQWPATGGRSAGVWRVSEGSRDSALTLTLPKGKDVIYPFIHSLNHLMRNCFCARPWAGCWGHWVLGTDDKFLLVLSGGWEGSKEGNSQIYIYLQTLIRATFIAIGAGG